MSVLQKNQLHNPLLRLLVEVLLRNQKLQHRKFPAVLSLSAKMMLFAGTEIRRSIFVTNMLKRAQSHFKKNRRSNRTSLVVLISLFRTADKHNVSRLFNALGVLPLGEFFLLLKCRRFCIHVYVCRLILRCYGFFLVRTTVLNNFSPDTPG